MKGIRRRFTKKDKKQLLDELRKSLGIITTACRKMNISRETFYQWYHNEEWFKIEYDEILEEQLDFVETKLIDSINDKNDKSIIFYLKTKGKGRGYREINEITLQSDNIAFKFGNQEEHTEPSDQK